MTFPVAGTKGPTRSHLEEEGLTLSSSFRRSCKWIHDGRRVSMGLPISSPVGPGDREGTRSGAAIKPCITCISAAVMKPHDPCLSYRRQDLCGAYSSGGLVHDGRGGEAAGSRPNSWS